MISHACLFSTKRFYPANMWNHRSKTSLGLPNNRSAREKFLEFSMLSKPKSGFPTRVFINIHDSHSGHVKRRHECLVDDRADDIPNGRGDVWSEHFINRESEYWIHSSKKSETVPDCGFLKKNQTLVMPLKLPGTRSSWGSKCSNHLRFRLKCRRNSQWMSMDCWPGFYPGHIYFMEKSHEFWWTCSTNPLK